MTSATKSRRRCQLFCVLWVRRNFYVTEYFADFDHWDVCGGLLLAPKLMGLTVLAAAILGVVLAIVLTAPLGAFAMDLSYKKPLKKE